MNGEIFYPLLLIVIMLVLMAVVGIGTSMVWLRVMDGRLRKCPNCNQKGGGYITESETLDSRSHMDFKGREPMRITIEELNDHYKCEQCGHTWSITFQRTDRERVRQ
jgi:hypothetical protein